MKISQTNNQVYHQPTKQKEDAVINNLVKSKENLAAQIQKLNQDKNIDEKTKQAKITQLQNQIEDLEKQIQKRQMEKIQEDAKKAITESSDSNSIKTAEDEQKEANISMSKNLISASTDKERLTYLGSLRKQLIAEDGGVSERVKRTERMMAERMVEINKSIDENQKATSAFIKSSKDVEEEKLAAKDGEQKENSCDNEISATNADKQVNYEQTSNPTQEVLNVESKKIHYVDVNSVSKQQETQRTTLSTTREMTTQKSHDKAIDISL